ncbi:MAG: transglycosylase SLT domain-containing protein, partial [Bacteroidales bacterium]|nr:transglycosylase SLT domain-containing protein [Bacteroidales bacterium]
SRGAIGLMQIKESVAKTYGINDIYHPEQNIKAGISHLARLQKLYKKAGADSTNIIKLTLASYNCGEGRLQDCMALAQQKGLDPLVWENIAEVIPLMKEEEHYKNDAVKLGRFNGGETLKFVEFILKRYGEYCKSVVK